MDTSTPLPSLVWNLLFQFKNALGITTSKMTNIANITYVWFSGSTKKLGRAIPTLNESDPSGFPYALETKINLAAASGLLGFLSGCSYNASFLYNIIITYMLFWFEGFKYWNLHLIIHKDQILLK